MQYSIDWFVDVHVWQQSQYLAFSSRIHFILLFLYLFKRCISFERQEISELCAQPSHLKMQI